MHVKLSTSRKLSMALLTLLAAARQSLQLYADPRLTSVKYPNRNWAKKIAMCSEPQWLVPPFCVSDSVNQTCKQAAGAAG